MLPQPAGCLRSLNLHKYPPDALSQEGQVILDHASLLLPNICPKERNQDDRAVKSAPCFLGESHSTHGVNCHNVIIVFGIRRVA